MTDFRYTDLADGEKSRLLFSGPQSTKRENGTVFLSDDEGKTWPVKRVLCKDGFAYSCVTALTEGTIGCLYEAEGTSKIVFARFTLDWLTALPASGSAALPHPVRNPESTRMLAGDWVPAKPQQIDFDKLPRVPAKHVVMSDVRAKGSSLTELNHNNGGVNQHNNLITSTANSGRCGAMAPALKTGRANA